MYFSPCSLLFFSIFNGLSYSINLLIVIGIGAIIFGLLVLYPAIKERQAALKGGKRIVVFPPEPGFHIRKAQEAEARNDYLSARVSYMACVDILKRDNTAAEFLDIAKNEYSLFVRRDPIFNNLLPFFLEGVRQNPGVLQSDITSKAEEMDWSELRQYSRTISKDDIRYVFYFAEEFGMLERRKKGRSYELYLPEQSERESVVNLVASDTVPAVLNKGHGDKAATKAKLRTDLHKERYERAMTSDLHPYLIYRIGNSHECSADHSDLDGLILSKIDPWWDTHLPPNGPHCNCYTTALTEDRKKRYEAEGVPVAPKFDGTGGGTIPTKTVVPDEWQ